LPGRKGKEIYTTERYTGANGQNSTVEEFDEWLGRVECYSIIVVCSVGFVCRRTSVGRSVDSANHVSAGSARSEMRNRGGGDSPLCCMSARTHDPPQCSHIGQPQ